MNNYEANIQDLTEEERQAIMLKELTRIMEERRLRGKHFRQRGTKGAFGKSKYQRK